MDNESYNYVCVNCGSPIKSLYKQYSQSVLKLCNCEHCGNVGDKYLEYDKIIILIDLILFSKEAYRHVLYNIQYKSHFKLALLQLIVISFDECIYNPKSVKLKETDSFYETNVCLLTVAIVLGKIFFFFVILIFLNLYNKYIVKKTLVKSSIVKIWEGIVFSSFGYFLLLTVLIWDDFQREIHIIFITTYIILSQIQALTVITAVPRPLLGAICIFATAVDCISGNKKTLLHLDCLCEKFESAYLLGKENLPNVLKMKHIDITSRTLKPGPKKHNEIHKKKTCISVLEE